MKKSLELRRFRLGLVASVLAMFPGCVQTPNAGYGDIRDWCLGRRHQNIIPKTPEDSVLALAREVTVLEDEMRRDGTITIKQPDVWGDGNLVHFIQEHDGLLAESVKNFEQTVQAYIARSDQAELQATNSVAQGLGGTPATQAPTATLIDIQNTDAFQALKTAFGTVSTPKGGGVGVEPTELERQRSTYILVNQSLRRRVSGDDNSRAAGYGLYKFRIPVSILPGRETTEGWSGVVSLRARLEVDAANLKFTFPKLVIADIVELLTPRIEAEWSNDISTDASNVSATLINRLNRLFEIPANEIATCDVVDEISEARFAAKDFEDNQDAVTFARLRAQLQRALCKLPDQESGRDTPSASFKKCRELIAVPLIEALGATEAMAEFVPGTKKDAGLPSARATSTPLTASARGEFQGQPSVDALRAAAKDYFAMLHGEDFKPATMELRTFLFSYLGQVQNIIEKRELYKNQTRLLDEAVLALERGQVIAGKMEGDFRGTWIRAFAPTDTLADTNLASVSWIVAIHSAILDRNMKKIAGEIRLRNSGHAEADGIEELVRFYAPELAPAESLQLWQHIIAEEFPLYVFTLDPQVEEQNAVDAFSRRRELQVALAYALASGKMNASRSLSFSRQLSLDQESIALNRTVVGFNHGRDTFGWYFHPRIQSPPVESSNIGALARLAWSTGPTDHYDYKHRRLEPGIRECEVLVAMPSFVNQVAFDVTSNWERIPRPGKTKRSYEEMVAQGGRLYRVQCELRELADERCFRPGDSARLISRVDQLEQMLGMQTHHVRVPYEYEQTGTDLFDTGNVHLKPIIHNFYGLRYVEANSSMNAHFFVAGKNFHPTLTHVIVGGTESHNVGGAAEVEVISREVLKVKLAMVNGALSADDVYELRIATPAGISNVVELPSKPAPAKPAKPAVSDFDWKSAPKYNGRLGFRNNAVEFDIEGVGPGDKLNVANNSTLPVAKTTNGRLLLRLVAETADGKVVPLGEIEDYPATNLEHRGFEVQWGGAGGLAQKIRAIVMDPVNGIQPSMQVSQIVGTAWIKFDAWPFVKFDKPVTITIQPVRLPTPTP